MHEFKIGDRVAKNPATWTASDLALGGRGEGVGVVVEPLLPRVGGVVVEVRWPSGYRSFEPAHGLMPAPDLIDTTGPDAAPSGRATFAFADDRLPDALDSGPGPFGGRPDE